MERPYFTLSDLGIIAEMCSLVEETERAKACQVIDSFMWAGRTSLPAGSIRRAFVQDVAATLNRHKVLPNDKVGKFQDLGYEYMQREATGRSPVKVEDLKLWISELETAERRAVDPETKAKIRKGLSEARERLKSMEERK